MMALRFEELDYQKTLLGELVLRRRSSPSLPGELVYEVTIDGEMLMSSTVNASERALARLALEGRDDRPLDVLVGRLGLGNSQKQEPEKSQPTPPRASADLRSLGLAQAGLILILKSFRRPSNLYPWGQKAWSAKPA